MIKREYYSLEAAAKLLGCDLDLLHHLAANNKILIHLLTDNLSYSQEHVFEGEEMKKVSILLPKCAPVTKGYWEQVESGVDPLFSVDVPDENGGSKMCFPPFLDFFGDPIKLNKFVILHNELEKILPTPPVSDPLKISDISESERNSMLKLIIGMAIDAYGYNPDSPRNSASGNKNGISAKLQAHGINITDDTIRKYLTEAKNII